MCVIETVLMRGFAFIVFAVITKWPMGKVSDVREKYWDKYKGK